MGRAGRRERTCDPVPPDPSDASPVDRIPGQNYVTPSSHIITPQTSHLHHDADAAAHPKERESVCVPQCDFLLLPNHLYSRSGEGDVNRELDVWDDRRGLVVY